MLTRRLYLFFFFFNDTATTEIYTLSLHDALPISSVRSMNSERSVFSWTLLASSGRVKLGHPVRESYLSSELNRDRKSTRLNSSHLVISYAVFCLKKKKQINISIIDSRSISSD